MDNAAQDNPSDPRTQAGDGEAQPPRTRLAIPCPSCGRTRLLWRNSVLDERRRCRTCAQRSAHESGKRKYRPKQGTTVSCERCGSRFYRFPYLRGRRFCSRACASAAKRRYPLESRTCATCAAEFRYSEKPFSNSSGNYCSIECRDQGYLGVVHGDREQPAKTDRHGWRSRRNRFVRSGNHFCTVCGNTKGRLHVHHIEGYRNAGFDDLSLVVTVCPRHHGLLEKWTEKIADLPAPYRRCCAVVLAGHLWEHQQLLIGLALQKKGGAA